MTSSEKLLRPDQQAIIPLIDAGSRVLDIGCGEGALLHYLEVEKQVQAQGLEIEGENVTRAVKQGLSVIQGDADTELPHYPDKTFDTVILAKSLQAMKQPKEVLKESLRIGQRVIVVIPNFGYLRNRLYLLLKGEMPVTKSLSYEWYETPNIHFCTIRDMIRLAEHLDATVEARYTIDKAAKAHAFSGSGNFGANLFAELGLFILRGASVDAA